MKEIIKLHEYQKELLRKLTYTQGIVRFNDLLIEGLESEHMNYHLQKIVDLGFVTKSPKGYLLTDQGKDFTNLMDDDVSEVEKQPKTSVLLTIGRKREGTNEEEFLFSKRLRQPYYGKVGMMGGKARFGETLRHVAERELMEETGLTAGSYKLLSIYHKLRKRENGEFVQDVFFYRFFVSDISGSLIKITPAQENFWATKEEIEKRDDIFDTLEIKTIDAYLKAPLTFLEDMGIAKDF